ncbi:MAG: PadR family transcriptional regulator [Planctomycetota bacterium]
MSTKDRILCALLASGEMFGREIRDAAQQVGGRIPLGTLYVTLDRLVEAGLVDFREGDPIPGKGGNRRKYFWLTGSGVAAATAIVEELRHWQGGGLGYA